VNLTGKKLFSSEPYRGIVFLLYTTSFFELFLDMSIIETNLVLFIIQEKTIGGVLALEADKKLFSEIKH